MELYCNEEEEKAQRSEREEKEKRLKVKFLFKIEVTMGWNFPEIRNSTSQTAGFILNKLFVSHYFRLITVKIPSTRIDSGIWVTSGTANWTRF